jgi:hypothetical protein
VTNHELIEQECERQMLLVESWDEEHENGVTAILGRWRVYHDEYADQGFYVDDEGVLSACVVGSEQYGNQRVSLSFMPSGMDGGVEVPGGNPLDVLELVE